jgi:hypothetical protein
MRALGLIVGGMFALAASTAGHAAPSGSNIKLLARANGIVQVWGGCGWGWHPVPGHWSWWRGGWVPPHCAPNHYCGGWSRYGAGQGHYGVWRSYGDWGGAYQGWDGSGS